MLKLVARCYKMLRSQFAASKEAQPPNIASFSTTHQNILSLPQHRQSDKPLTSRLCGGGSSQLRGSILVQPFWQSGEISEMLVCMHDPWIGTYVVQWIESECKMFVPNIYWAREIFGITSKFREGWEERGCSHITSAKIRGSWTTPPSEMVRIWLMNG